MGVASYLRPPKYTWFPYVVTAAVSPCHFPSKSVVSAFVRQAVERVNELVGVELVNGLLPRLDLAGDMHATNQSRVG